MKKVTSMFSVAMIIFSLTACGSNAPGNFQESILTPADSNVKSYSVNKPVKNNSSRTPVRKNSLLGADQEANLVKSSFEAPDKMEAVLGLAESIADLKPNTQQLLINMATRFPNFKPGERQTLITGMIKFNLNEDIQFQLIKSSFDSPFYMEAIVGVIRGVDHLNSNSQQLLINMATRFPGFKPGERQKIIAELAKNPVPNNTPDHNNGNPA